VIDLLESEWTVRLVWFATLCAEDINDAMLYFKRECLSEEHGDALTLSPPILECDVVVRLNMLVTLARSLSSELLLVGLPLPLILAICGGVFDRSTWVITSGSSVNGLARIFDRSELSLVLGGCRSDVFVGFARRGVIVSVDC